MHLSKLSDVGSALDGGTDLSIYSNKSEFSTTGAQSKAVDAITSGIESIQFGMERDLSEQMKRERRETLTQDDEISRKSIIFSDSRSTKHSDDSHKAKGQDKDISLKKAANTMFYKPGDESEGTDDSVVEEIPRSEVGEALNVDMLNEDAVLFIKMTPYPLTLEEFIVSKSSVEILTSTKLTLRSDSGPTFRLPTQI